MAVIRQNTEPNKNIKCLDKPWSAGLNEPDTGRQRVRCMTVREQCANLGLGQVTTLQRGSFPAEQPHSCQALLPHVQPGCYVYPKPTLRTVAPNVPAIPPRCVYASNFFVTADRPMAVLPALLVRSEEGLKMHTPPQSRAAGQVQGSRTCYMPHHLPQAMMAPSLRACTVELGAPAF